MAAERDAARELVALPGWHWQPGMRWCRVVAEGADPATSYGRLVDPVALPADALPDLKDPGTVGAVLGAVRQKVGAYVAIRHVGVFADGKCEYAIVDWPHAPTLYGYRSESDALVAAYARAYRVAV